VQTQENNLADVLKHLSDVLEAASETVRNLKDEEGGNLPPTLSTRHMAELYDKNPSSIWRMAKLGRLPPPTSGPGEKMTWDRGMVLDHRRRLREKALARARAMAEG
jgi:hypothetical protein